MAQELAKAADPPTASTAGALRDDSGEGAASGPNAARGTASASSTRAQTTGKAGGRTSKRAGGSSIEQTEGSTSAKPVPKFRKRKAVEAASGQAFGDEATPLVRKAKTLGSSLGGGEPAASEKSELAKLRAAKKALQEAAAAEEQATAEAERLAQLAARPLPVVIVERIARLLQAMLAALISFARQLLLPSEVSFD